MAFLLAACGQSAPTAATSAPATAVPKPTVPSASPASSPAAAAPSASPKPAASGSTETVKMVHVPATLFAPLYVAIEKGYFAEQGIGVQLDRVAAGQDAMALVANGSLDVVVAGFSAATFNAVQRGLDIKIVSSMGRQPHEGYPSALMVRKDLLDSGAVKEMKDLKGRKVGLSGGLGATGSYWMATKLRTGGLSLKDVDIQNMDSAAQVAALTTKAIDAAFPSTPTTTEIRKAGTADFFGGVTEPGASAVGVTYGGPFVKNHPDLARRVALALVKGARAIQGQGYFAPDNLAAYAKYTGTPVETLKGMDPYEFDPDLLPDTKTLLDMEQVFIAEKVLDFAQPIPTEKFVDDSYVKAAAQQLGAYKP